MKRSFRSALPALPSRADGTLLPALLAAVLAVAALLQFALTDGVALPPTGPVGVGAPVSPVADPVPRGIPGAVLARPLFAPSATSGGGGGGAADAAPADPLGGAQIAGSIGVGRTRVAIVTLPGGRLRRVGIGGVIAGWRLVALTDEGAVLARGRERLRRGFASGDLPAAQTTQSDDSEDQ